MKPAVRWLFAAAACAVIYLLARYWAHVRNEFFVLLGSRNEAGGWYGFHSGAGGAFWMSAIPAGLLLYWHHTCQHSAWCLRWGKYAVAGGVGRKCRWHHPDLRDHPREHHGQVLDRLHEEWKERTSR